MIERNFDVPFIAGLAYREKQIQQNYRPVIAVHKWFARRPGTLFRGLLLSEFLEKPLREVFYQSNDLSGIRVADPFMGGGILLLEANRLGCDVVGYDINPLSYWIVREEIESINLVQYKQVATHVAESLENQVGHLFRTRCTECGSPDAPVKYFLWVKTQRCCNCGSTNDLFPGYLVAANVRHPRNVFVCPECGVLSEVEERKNPGACASCSASLSPPGPARQGRFICKACGVANDYPDPGAGPPQHRMFAIEYRCARCRPRHEGRFFKRPDLDDLAKYAEAGRRWAEMQPSFVPDEEIPAGDETNRLHRWGYRRYRDMFNERQLLCLELTCREISSYPDERVRNALATNLSDLLRYQNMLCRYDTVALKSLDIFSVHGFPVGLVQCESNFLGITSRAKGASIGSGGWVNITEKYIKAKSYCERPFEITHRQGKKTVVYTPGEWIGDHRRIRTETKSRQINLICDSATSAEIEPHSIDMVLTDPPYFGNVQYAELVDFCYVWLRRLVSTGDGVFRPLSTRNPDELTGNQTMARGLEHFTRGLSEVFCRMSWALKPGRPLVFTYHHNTLEAYYPVAVAILDAGLTCTASFPCPGEMGASIHINGTGSSIVDTVFVCRSTSAASHESLAETPEHVAALVQQDLDHLRSAGIKPTKGDARCIIFGHLTRLGTWQLSESWDESAPIGHKLAMIGDSIRGMGGPSAVEQCLADRLSCIG
ncbi:MAG: DNA methylase [Bacillota bacterium]